MIKAHIPNATVINPFFLLLYIAEHAHEYLVFASAVTKLQTRAAQPRLTFVNVILKLTASVQTHGCIEREKKIPMEYLYIP